MRSSATRCARRRARPRSTASSRISAPPSPPPCRASRRSSRRSAPSSWSARSTTARSSRPPGPCSTISRRNAPLMTPERIGAAMQALFTGSGPRMLLVSPAPVAGGEAALAEGLAAARAAAPAVRDGRAAGQLRRPAAARAAGPGGLAPADRGHGRHHRPLRQRLDPDLQADRFRARLGAGPAALRRRHRRPRARPAVARLARPGWSRPRASPVSTSTGWSGC